MDDLLLVGSGDGCDCEFDNLPALGRGWANMRSCESCAHGTDRPRGVARARV